MFMLKIKKNKENNQHCLKPFVGWGREQSKGPDIVWVSTSALKEPSKNVCWVELSRSKHVLMVLSHFDARGGLGHKLVTHSGQWDGAICQPSSEKDASDTRKSHPLLPSTQDTWTCTSRPATLRRGASPCCGDGADRCKGHEWLCCSNELPSAAAAYAGAN